MKLKYLIVISILIVTTSYSQIKDYDLGTPYSNSQQKTGGYYDYSDPFSVNFKVSIWGYVRFAGRYNIPENLSLLDLISYAGGPNDNALLEDVRLYRLNDDGTQELILFDYDDLWREETLYDETRRLIPLQAGDILVMPGEPRLYFKDWYAITISTIGTLVSLVTLIVVLNQ